MRLRLRGHSFGRSLAALFGVLAVSACVTRPVFALPEEDRAFLGFLIRDLKYYDVAIRFLMSIEKRRTLDLNDQSEIASLRIDILKAEGKVSEADKAVAEFQKRFPSHARSSLQNLEAIGGSLKKALDTFDRSAVEPDKALADGLRKESSSIFQNAVSKPMDALIADLQKKVDAARKTQGTAKPGAKATSKDLSAALRSLEYTELMRINFLLAYAKRLQESAAERKESLTRGQKLAETFVNERGDFPVMQFDAQLYAGLFTYELGQHVAAEQALSILYDAEPPAARPFAKELADTFRRVRLQAILYGARSMSAAGNFTKAVQIIDQYFYKMRDEELDLRKAENEPELRSFAVGVRLEHGLALAGSGALQKGLDEVQSIIRQPGLPTPLLTDARKALGRLALLGTVKLRGADYYEAAMGLKSAFSFEAALDTFQLGLTALSSTNRKELNSVAPLCLNEIGEINFILGRFVESALAYQEICEWFQGAQEQIVAKAATNFLAATTRAIKTTPGGATHAGLTGLKASASKASEKYSSGFAIFESYMFDGARLESEGKWEAAKAEYVKVEPELKGQKVPFYWRAQAKAWTCVCRAWEEADAERKKTMETEVDEAISALRKVSKKALEARENVAAAIASISVGSVLYQRADWKGAAEALEVFTAELSGEETYRCAGLGSLIFAEIKLEDLALAGKHYSELKKICGDLPVAATTASALSDAHQAAGQLKEAAEYALIYAKHPSSKAEMEQPREITRVARLLIEGGMNKESESFVAALKGSKKDPQFDADRELILLETKALQHAKQWDKVIAKLEAFVKQYKPQEDKSYDDAYVLRDLGLAYMARVKSKPQAKDLKDAEAAYNRACFVMRQRAEREPSLEKTFWQWVEELMEIEMALGDAGDNNAYRNIINQVSEAESNRPELVSPKLKELAKLADEKLKKRVGEPPATPAK